jgi:DNA-binding response OmpR family regulator
MIELIAPTVAPQAPPETIQSPAPVAAPAAAALRVLLVEDDAEAAELVRMYLAHDDDGSFYLERVANLFDAMQRLTQPGVDVVLLDLGLPELSGYKSHFAITRASQRGLPVVIFTGDQSLTSKMRTMKLGAADYLVKDQTSPAQLRLSLRAAVLRGSTPPS